MLAGLVEPKKDRVEAFNEWYLGNHVEDTFNYPKITSLRCFKAPWRCPSAYLSIYEFEGEDAEAAEKILGEYQADTNAWPKRKPNSDSMEIAGAGRYLKVLAFS